MNLEIEEIINAVIDLNIFSLISFFAAIGGPMATVLTLVGSSLSKAFTKLLDLKNRKTVKYMVCNKVRNYTFYLVIAALELFYLKFFYYFLFPLIFFAFLIIILSLLGSYKFIICTQIVLIILSRFVIKRFIRSENLNYKITALLFPVIAVLQTYFLLSNSDYFLFITVILGYVIIDCVILVLVYAHKKNRAVLWFAIPRHIILYLVFYLLLYSGIQNTILTVGAILWGVLIIIEFPIHIITAADIIPVTIHTVEGVKTTKSRIMQYECNKIMYKLEDGTIEVIDEDSILYMSYITPVGFRSIKYKIIHLTKYICMRFKKYPMKNSSVECLFKGKELEEIQTYEIINYKYIQESWIRMEVRDGDYKFDIIVNANRVKKIVCRN